MGSFAGLLLGMLSCKETYSIDYGASTVFTTMISSKIPFISNPQYTSTTLIVKGVVFFSSKIPHIDCTPTTFLLFRSRYPAFFEDLHFKFLLLQKSRTFSNFVPIGVFLSILSRIFASDGRVMEIPNIAKTRKIKNNNVNFLLMAGSTMLVEGSDSLVYLLLWLLVLA